MTGTKRKAATLEDIVERPWCYYCDRDFDDDKILQDHQKVAHFACDHCSRKLNTASGLMVHTQQVHKLTVERIRGTIAGRESPNLEIFGMVGVPEDVLNAHRQTIIDAYVRRAAEHKKRTGNPLPGTVQHDPNKKTKFDESKEDKRARLEAHRAAKRAEKAQREAAEAELSKPKPPAPSPNGPPTYPPPDVQPSYGVKNPNAAPALPTHPKEMPVDYKMKETINPYPSPHLQPKPEALWGIVTPDEIAKKDATSGGAKKTNPRFAWDPRLSSLEEVKFAYWFKKQ